MISLRQIISRSAGLILAIFSPNESVLGADDRPRIFFRYLKGPCDGNRFCEKMANSILSSLWHSETEWNNAMYMHDLISTLMPLYRVIFQSSNFGREQPNGNCVACSRRLAYFVEYISGCSAYWTDFRNLFTIWKHFTSQWWIFALFSNLSMDVAIATKCCRNESKQILRAFFARLPDVSTICFATTCGRHWGAERAIS